MKSVSLSVPSTRFDNQELHLASSCWCSWLLVHARSSALRSSGGWHPVAGVITIVWIQSIAKISCNTSPARGKSIQWAAWTNLCSINVAFQTLWQCLCSKKMVKTSLPPIITALLLPLGKQCQTRKGAQLAVTREYVGECRKKGKDEFTLEAFLSQKGIYEERMRTWRLKTEKEGKRKISEMRTCKGREKKGGKEKRKKTTQNKELEELKHILWSMILMLSCLGQICPNRFCCLAPALLATIAQLTPLTPFGQHRKETTPSYRTVITGLSLSARYNGWALLHSPLSSHSFSRNLKEFAISCHVAPPSGLAAISKQVPSYKRRIDKHMEGLTDGPII